MSPRARRATSWFLLALAAVVVAVLVWAVRSGGCADVGGHCGSAPALGTAGAWVVTVACVLVASAALRRGVRVAQASRGPVDG